MIIPVIVIGMTVGSFILANQIREHDRSSAFERISIFVNDRIQRTAPSWFSLTQAGNGFLSSPGGFSPFAVAAFEVRIKETFSEIEHVSVIPEIASQNRESHEAALQSMGIMGYQVSDLSPDGTLSPASVRDFYYPTFFGQPMGLDIGTRADWLQLIGEARDSGETRSAILEHADIGVINAELGLMFPVYRSQVPPATVEQRRSTFAGVSFISLAIDSIFDAAMFENMDGILVQAFVIDEADSNSKELVFSSPGFNASDSPTLQTQITVHDLSWLLTFKEGPSLPETWDRWTLLLLPVVVGVIMSAISVFIVLLIAQRHRAQLLVERMVEISNEKERFLSTVSHELKTPLTSVKAFAEILRKNKSGHLDERELNQANLIARNSSHLNVLIDDILDVSRLRTGTFELEHQVFGIDTFMEDMYESLLPIADLKGQILKTSGVGSELLLRADRPRIDQVIRNLVSNGSKYSPPESFIELDADVRGDWLRITVTDHGIGLSEADLNLIGTPFFRADNNSTRAQSGTGLGLFISKTITELHGGTFNVRSVSDQGTTVTVMLPGIVTAADAPAYLEASDEAGLYHSRLEDAAMS
ncbi:MAG: CHASE domain-containing protein [Chloroflexi bacterium]|nr:CHASE domain-containing protein [Chloroflexota bacterium]